MDVTSQIGQVAKLPIVIGFCFAILFYYLHWAFLSGLAIFLIAFLCNKYLAEKGGKLRKAGMKCADARVKAINESIGSIKMLKLYSWTDIFAKSI